MIATRTGFACDDATAPVAMTATATAANTTRTAACLQLRGASLLITGCPPVVVEGGPILYDRRAPRKSGEDGFRGGQAAGSGACAGGTLDRERPTAFSRRSQRPSNPSGETRTIARKMTPMTVLKLPPNSVPPKPSKGTWVLVVM